MKKSYLFLLPITLFLAAGCVSKRKYLEMEAGKLRAENRVRELTNENEARAKRITSLIADFEAEKTSLLASHAEKDQYLDSLNSELVRLSGNLSEQSESMEEKMFSFEFEKRRLNEALVEKDRQISSLDSQLKSTAQELTEKQQELERLGVDLDQEKEKNRRTEGARAMADEKVTSLEARLDQLKSQVAKLQEDLRKKDETITRLTNNVNLLKKELENK